MITVKLTSVLVDDQAKALRFYTDVLGFRKKKDIPMGEFRWLTTDGQPGYRVQNWTDEDGSRDGGCYRGFVRQLDPAGADLNGIFLDIATVRSTRSASPNGRSTHFVAGTKGP
jgi:catechol 2,3-dioxygenase-like lactoylglutathione lyase family enzyme